MRAELKYIHSPDIDLDNYWPEKEDDLGFLLQAMIGPEGENSEESFEFQVCTPTWLKKENEGINDCIFGVHMLIVFEYELNIIREKIKKYCESCTGKDWQSIALKLSRVGRWEFEGYSE